MSDNKPGSNVGLWVGLTIPPAEDGIFIARKKNGERICIQRRGGVWQDHEEAHQWFCTPDDLLDAGSAPLPDPETLVFSDDFLMQVSEAELRTMMVRPPEPTDQEFAATAALARRELSLLNIEVFRVYRVGVKKSGIVTGKALSVSENFAAQATEDGNVVIHDMARLTQAVPGSHIQPGEEITVVYEDGSGLVHKGQMECFGLRISSKGLSVDEVEFIRDRTQSVIAGRIRWVELDQSQLNDVVIEVCHQAKEKFGWAGIPRSLVVAKYDVVADQLQSAMQEANARVERAADEKGFLPAPAEDASWQAARPRQG